MAPPTNPPRALVPPTGAAWFRAGTGLMTLRGEIPVEQVRVGDQALTLSGEGAPLKPVERVAQLITSADRTAASRFFAMLTRHPRASRSRATAAALCESLPQMMTDS